MTEDYSQFRRRISTLKNDICREIYERNRDRIKVKNASVAVCRLETILDGTLEIGNRQGFQAMSVRDLSEHTGISMGALYSYIESKEKLLQMILSHGRLAVERVLGDAPASISGARDRLRWLLRSHLYLTELLQPWFYFAYMESRHFSKDAREHAMEGELRTEAIITTCLRDGMAEDTFRQRDPELTAALIKPLLQDWYLKRWKYRRRRVNVDAYADAVIDFVESAVLPPKGGEPDRHSSHSHFPANPGR